MPEDRVGEYFELVADGFEQRHDDDPALTDFSTATAAAIGSANIPSERSSRSKASTPSRPRFTKKPMQRPPLMIGTSGAAFTTPP
jgi:hypothetical protein